MSSFPTTAMPDDGNPINKVLAALSVEPETLTILEYDTALLHPAPGNREVTLEDVAELIESIRREGQLVDGIVYPHEIPGHYYVADGNRRMVACRNIPIPFKARCLPTAPTEAQLIRLRIAANHHRKNPNACELADEMQALARAEGIDIHEAGEMMGLNGPYRSKILKIGNNACTELRDAVLKGKVPFTTAYHIARLPHDRQRELTKLVVDGDLVRKGVELRVEMILDANRPKKVKVIKVAFGGVTMLFPSDWTTLQMEQHIARLNEVKKQLEKAGLPPRMLPELLHQ